MLGFLLDGCGLFPRLFPRLGHVALPEVSTRPGGRCIDAGRSLTLRQVHKAQPPTLLLTSATAKTAVVWLCVALCTAYVIWLSISAAWLAQCFVSA